MNKNYNTNTQHSLRWIATLVAIILLAVSVAAALTNGFTTLDPFGWFSETSFEKEFALEHNKNIRLTSLNANAMNLSFAGMHTTTPYDDSTGKITISATIEPQTADNKNINWSIKWENSTSGGQHSGGAYGLLSDSYWGTGRTVTDYVMLSTQSTVSGESLELDCLQDFGEPIIVTATSAADASVSARCVVDYRKKVSSLTYEFAYNGNSMTTPAVGSDGVYRVDYTGKECYYAVKCTPNYTNFTVDDTFEMSVLGTFSKAFAEGKDISLTDISLQAGLIEPVNETLTDNCNAYVTHVTNATKTMGNGLITAMSSASDLYEALTDTEKAHTKVTNAYSAFVIMNECMLANNNILTDDVRNEAIAILDGYVAPPSEGNFHGITFANEDALLTAANAANRAGTGIFEYVITFTSEYYTQSFIFKIGYTADSLAVVRDMRLSETNIVF